MFMHFISKSVKSFLSRMSHVGGSVLWLPREVLVPGCLVDGHPQVGAPVLRRRQQVEETARVAVGKYVAGGALIRITRRNALCFATCRLSQIPKKKKNGRSSSFFSKWGVTTTHHLRKEWEKPGGGPLSNYDFEKCPQQQPQKPKSPA